VNQENKVNLKTYNFTTREGVNILIDTAWRTHPMEPDNSIITVLVEALKYWSDKALSEETK
jgi:hypothetical protein